MSEVNKALSLERFQAIIREKTISDKDGNFDKEVFSRFLPLLQELYPDAFKVLEAERVNEFGILLRWKGKDSSLKPVVTMAHHDVVDAKDSEWEHPPFAAEVHDGVLWGRGTIDTKCIVSAILESMERLIKEGFVPERDVYFASSNCEEVGGDTMIKIADLFKERNIEPYFVLDEGGAIMKSLPMGIKTPFAMVALSEKGWATVRLTAKSKSAAHGAKATGSSKKSAPSKLVEAVAKLEKTPSEATITPALEEMLRRFAPYVSGVLSFVFKNLWLFRPIVKKAMESNADTAAMIRSTFILTKLETASGTGLVPEEAYAEFRVRIAPQDSFDDLLTHIKNTVGEDIEVEVTNRSDAPRISDFDTEAFDYVEKTVKKVFPEIGVSPFILNAGTDSRHFAPICPRVYRFGAFPLDDDRFATVHGNNERMPLEDYYNMIDFYTELLKGV